MHNNPGHYEADERPEENRRENTSLKPVHYPWPIVAAPYHRWPMATEYFEQLCGCQKCVYLRMSMDCERRLNCRPVPLPPFQHQIIPAQFSALGLPPPNAPNVERLKAIWRVSPKPVNWSAQVTRGKARINTKKMCETGTRIYTDAKTWLLGWSSVYCDWTEGVIGGEDGRKGKSKEGRHQGKRTTGSAIKRL